MAAYFSKALYLRNLKRFWLISVAVFIVAFFSFISTEIVMRNYRRIAPGDAVVDILTPLQSYGVIFIPIFSIITAIAMFGYLHKLKSAGFVSSLPVSRLGLYITNWLSGLTIMLAPTLLIGALYGALLIGQPVPRGHFLIWIGIILAVYLFFYSMAVFTAFLTGNPVMQVFLFAFINFISLIIIGMGYFIAEILVFGFTEGISNDIPVPAALLSPPFSIWIFISGFDPSWNSDALLLTLIRVIYPLLIPLLMFFGYWLYRRRRIESAGVVIVHKPVRSVFKYLIGLLTGSLLGYALTEIINTGSYFSTRGFVIVLTTLVIIFGALGCFFTEMLIRKRVRVWKTAWRSMMFFAAGIIAVVLFIRLDVTGYERRVPDSGDVAAVIFSTARLGPNSILLNDGWEPDADFSRSGRGWTLSNDCNCGKCFIERTDFVWTEEIVNEIKWRTFDYFESPEAINAAVELHRAIIRDKPNMEMRAIGQSGGVYHRGITSQRYFLTYKMKNGQIITRQYVISDNAFTTSDVVGQTLDLLNQPEAVNKRNRFTELPDTAILWANAAIYHGSENSAGFDIIQYSVLEEVMDVVLEAMRQDAAAGTLGYIDVGGGSSGNLSLRSVAPAENSKFITMRIVYDFDSASIPAAFKMSSMFDEDTEEHVEGLLLTIDVNEYNVNTMRVFSKLGFFDE